MKYLLPLILFVSVFSLQSLQAAVPVAPTSIEERLFSSIDEGIFRSSDIIGIGRIAGIARDLAPIQTLENIVNPLNRRQTQTRNDSSTRMGLRIYTLMGGERQFEAANIVSAEPSLAVSTEIIGGDADIDAFAVQGGRMYPPRLVVDFQKFPVPTYATMPNDEQQKRMTKLNGQLQKRFGEAVQVDYLENVHYLRGTVVSERQKEVLELFVKMEPGIQEVRNEVVIRE